MITTLSAKDYIRVPCRFISIVDTKHLIEIKKTNLILALLM